MSVAGVKPMHCLSFDVEEHFQVSAFWSEARRQQWDTYESRVENNTRKLIELLAQHGTKATFFVLGWVAERHPDLVKLLMGQGHEIASHGYGHELVTTQSPEQFRHDVRKAKNILEDLIGSPVLGYRAPSFSITDESRWALAILVEEGYKYDSSMYDRFQRSENARGNSGLVQIDTVAGRIWEISPSTLNVCGFQVPVAGGGYFRLFPYATSKTFLQRLGNQVAKLGRYLHPWEFDPEQPRMDGPWLSQFRHYLNLHKMEKRLTALLGDFQFGSIAEVLGSLWCKEHEKIAMADWAQPGGSQVCGNQSDNRIPSSILGA